MLEELIIYQKYIDLIYYTNNLIVKYRYLTHSICKGENYGQNSSIWIGFCNRKI